MCRHGLRCPAAKVTFLWLDSKVNEAGGEGQLLPRLPWAELFLPRTCRSIGRSRSHTYFLTRGRSQVRQSREQSNTSTRV